MIHEIAGCFQTFGCHARGFGQTASGDISLQADVAAVNDNQTNQDKRYYYVCKPVICLLESIVDLMSLLLSLDRFDM